MRNRSGFTLIELLVVLSIIGLIATLVPFIHSRVLAGTRLTFAIRTITSQIYRAEERSTSSGSTVYLSLQDLSAAMPPGVVVRPESYAPEQPALALFPDGSAHATRLIVSSGGKARTLIINALTGAVEGA